MFPYMNQSVYEQNLENIIQQANGQLQQLRNRPTPTNLTQNFQITPQNSTPNDLQSAYVSGVEEVKNIFMTKNGIFVDKGLTNLWFKNTEGNIRAFTLQEVVQKDEKDLEIEELKKQLENLKKKGKKENE